MFIDSYNVTNFLTMQTGPQVFLGFKELLETFPTAKLSNLKVCGQSTENFI